MTSKKKYSSLIISAFLLIFCLLILPGCTNTTSTKTSEDNELASSQKAVKEILEKAKEEWSKDAEIHQLTSDVNSIYVNNQRIFNGYKEGKFISWIARLYSPSKNQVVMSDWTSGKISLGESYGEGDSLSTKLESQIINLNALKEKNSSTEIYQKALEKGLNTKKYYYTMKITGAQANQINENTSPYTWYVYEKDPNNFDDKMQSVTVNTYTITP
ncbi:MAG: hypothetical protein U5L76_05395 [Patescibacteria group bacterium]|nr:hypothetical protein [Patescibacteria group bacterium]